MVIQVHKFITEQEAFDAIDTINLEEGIPKNDNSVTERYAIPIASPDFFYIICDNITIEHLGEGEFVDIQPVI